MGGASGYRASLLAVAESLVRARAIDPALGLTMARTTNLARRLAWIDQTHGSTACLLQRPARLGVLLAVLTLAGLLGTVELTRARVEAQVPVPATPVAQAPPADRPAAIEVEVLGRDTGQPLPGATVDFFVNRTHVFRQADAAGKVRLDLASEGFPDSLGFDLWADGYVQQRYGFAKNDARLPQIPSRITIQLWPGEETLGGQVVNEAGEPVAGATVRVWGYLGALKDKHELAYMVAGATDQAGQWRMRNFRTMKFAHLYLAHPDYLSGAMTEARVHGRTQPADAADAAAGEREMVPLRDLADVQVLKRGVELMGRVVDARNQPVAGAEVGCLPIEDRHVFHDHLILTSTEASGAFRLPHVRPGPLVVQVKASGHAPELKTVDPGRAGEPVVIQLEPPRRLTGRVVDSGGRPIEGMTIFVDTWRGFRSLGVALKTDAAGRFEWTDAPADPVDLAISGPGFEYAKKLRVAADSGEVSITLRRSLDLSGTIRDAVTRRTVEDAWGDVGVADAATGGVVWQPRDNVFTSQGRLQANLDAEAASEYRLRVQAKGFEPYQTRPIRSDEGQVELDVRLAPATDPGKETVAGVVQGPDGRPLAGAEVGLSYTPVSRRTDQLPRIQIADGRIKPEVGQALAITDTAGRFSMLREPASAWKSYAVVVAHPDGFAAVKPDAFAAHPVIVVEPWGRVKGTARIGDQVAGGMELRYRLAPRLGLDDIVIGDSGVVRADAAGRYQIERVVPGEVRVARGYDDRSIAPTWASGTLVKVTAGEAVNSDVGGGGRPVLARVAVPGGFDPAANYNVYSRFNLTSDRPLNPPMEEPAARFAYRRDWFELARATLQPDGSIRVEDVPPGDYRLELIHSADPTYGSTGSANRIATATRRFTVPPIPGGRTDEPFDLGTLRPELRREGESN